MTATEEIRRLLDERGVEYETCDEPSMWYTCWRLAGYDMMNACFEEMDGLVPSFYIRNATPEQAIAATLGPGTCRMERDFTRWEDDDCYYVTSYTCSVCADSYLHIGNGKPKACPNCGRKVVDV